MGRSACFYLFGEFHIRVYIVKRCVYSDSLSHLYDQVVDTIHILFSNMLILRDCAWCIFFLSLQTSY
jgi:hypothetical protein